MKGGGIIICYLPALHRGYIELFKHYKDIKSLGIFGEDIIKKFDHLRKDIRALSPEQSKKTVTGLKYFNDVRILDWKDLESLGDKYGRIVMPDDDLSKNIINEIKHTNVELYPVFLRWHRDNIKTQVAVSSDREVGIQDISSSILNVLMQEKSKSHDWWRQVSTVVTDVNGRVIGKAFNRHQPTSHSPYIDGEMRMNLKRGDGIEYITAEHAEAACLANIAKTGIATENGTMYVSTFPCPVCAKFIASAGISKVYFIEGYAVADGLNVLRSHGVEVIKIKDIKKIQEPEKGTLEYPEKTSQIS